MSKNLDTAIKILKENTEYTCVLCEGEDVFTSKQRGIGRLIDWVKAGNNFNGFSATDKIVGKAAALLYVLLGVREVYGEVMSKKAAEVFEEYHVEHSCAVLTEAIINRKGTGPCPMEETVENIDDPKEAFKLLELKLKSIKYGKINLVKADLTDCTEIHKMQATAFKPLLEKYQDFATNPGAETIKTIKSKMKKPLSDYYFIQINNTKIGAVRIVRLTESKYRIAPIFILPEFQGRGYGLSKQFEKLKDFIPRQTTGSLIP